MLVHEGGHLPFAIRNYLFYAQHVDRAARRVVARHLRRYPCGLCPTHYIPVPCSIRQPCEPARHLRGTRRYAVRKEVFSHNTEAELIAVLPVVGCRLHS